MVASSVRDSPLLSVHLTTTLSPLLAPLNLKLKNGFCDTAPLQAALSTSRPLCVATTSVM
ncbi:hypothetical protein Talka_02336 [Tepidimonas alkaliphilus]|uniref:Uncharacterized protein n=1 Tax=Tepidimonas alkaliphilus TaxID=2588942 RepID=A0A554W3K1_9BURK|nr:hypothetical protein Talka_02336 [Tepidimonas alkaliphilus]